MFSGIKKLNTTSGDQGLHHELQLHAKSKSFEKWAILFDGLVVVSLLVLFSYLVWLLMQIDNLHELSLWLKLLPLEIVVFHKIGHKFLKSRSASSRKAKGTVVVGKPKSIPSQFTAILGYFFLLLQLILISFEKDTTYVTYIILSLSILSWFNLALHRFLKIPKFVYDNETPEIQNISMDLKPTLNMNQNQSVIHVGVAVIYTIGLMHIYFVMLLLYYGFRRPSYLSCVIILSGLLNMYPCLNAYYEYRVNDMDIFTKDNVAHFVYRIFLITAGIVTSLCLDNTILIPKQLSPYMFIPFYLAVLSRIAIISFDSRT
jgi:hypothetical protein